MKKLVINADDFGRSSPINQAIIEAHQNGLVTSASLMTTRDGFEEALQLARANPRLGVGLHLDLDAYFIVEHGTGRLQGYRDETLSLSAIARETEQQIQRLAEQGIGVSHLDGHHHVHLRPELFATVAAIASAHRIPFIRYFPGFYQGMYPGVPMSWIPELIQRFGLRSVDQFFAGWGPVTSSLPGYVYFDPQADFSVAELMVHPGYGEGWREEELRRCLSEEARNGLATHGIHSVSFRDL